MAGEEEEFSALAPGDDAPARPTAWPGGSEEEEFATLAGGDDGPSPVALPPDLMAAIRAAASADAALAGIAGGFWRGKLPPDARGSTPPASYCVFTEPSSALLSKSTTSVVTDRRVRFRVYAADGDDAEHLGKLLAAAAPRWGALPYDGGVSVALVQVGGMGDPARDRRAGDKAAWYREVTFSARTIEPA